METDIQFLRVAPDPPPESLLTPAQSKPPAVLVEFSEADRVSPGQLAVERGEQQCGQVFDGPAGRDARADLRAVQVNHENIERLVGWPVRLATVFDEEMRDVIIAMVQSIVVECAGD